MDILEKQMQAIPAQYAFWSAVYSEVRLAVSVAERNLKVRKGKATEEIQRAATINGIKITADQVKTIVEADNNLVDADLRLQTAMMQAGKLYHMLEALKMKAELGRSLCGFKKAELATS